MGRYKLPKCGNLSDGEEYGYRFSETYFEMCWRNTVWLRELKKQQQSKGIIYVITESKCYSLPEQ